MFRKITRFALSTALALGATVATTGLAGGTAAAAGSCGTRSTFKAFTQWGDQNEYFLLPGGSFESGTSGWSLGGSSVVTDQAPWKVNGSKHAKALNVPAYTTVMPANICINSNEEWMRFFYKDPGVRGAQLLVKIEAWSSAGRAIQEIKIDSGSAGWKVSNQIPMPNKRDSKGEQWITLTITPVSTAATWRLDDIMIDPWVSR